MHQLIIYVQSSLDKEEEVVLLPVSLTDTTSDIIKITLEHLNIPFNSKYRLYESKFSVDKNATINRTKKINRQILRALHREEAPLVVMYSWIAQRDQLLMNLVLQPKESSLKHDKLYEKLPLDSLYRRLSVVEKEEEKRVLEVKSKYEAMRRLIIRRLNNKV